MPAQPLPTSAPAAQGVDARGVHALLDALEAAPDVEPHSLVVLRHGHVVAAGWWSPYTAQRPHLLYSLSKSFASAAAGLAVAEGLMSLDDTVLSHFPELDADITDPRSRKVLVRHVAAMASGHDDETLERANAADPTDLVRGFLLLPPEEEPGTVFAYNQPCTYALGAIVQRASGQSLTQYLRPRLFDPLGIDDVGWQQQPPGTDLGFSGLHATTDAVARFGQLLLQGGVWAGEQVLSAEWVAEATRSHVSTAARDQPDWQQGYGFQFWRARHGYRGDGAYGQFCVVLPEQDAVVAITAATPVMQTVLDGVWTHLLPALGGAGPDGGGPDGAGDAALAERLRGLALPPVTAEPAPPGDAGAWADATFTPAGGTCADQPSLVGVTVAADGDGHRVTLVEPGSELAAHLGTSGWSVSQPLTAQGPLPVALSGGWTPAGELRVDVVFLETPHRLVVTCASRGATFEAHWVTAPLWPRTLHDLRSPRVG